GCRPRWGGLRWAWERSLNAASSRSESFASLRWACISWPSASTWPLMGSWAIRPRLGRGRLDRGGLDHRRGGGDQVLGELALGGEHLAVEVEAGPDDLLRCRQALQDRDRRQVRRGRLHGLRPALDGLDDDRLALAQRPKGPLPGGGALLRGVWGHG